MTFTHDSYLSPMAWRYGSPAMRGIWSEVEKRRLWRRVWLALARARHAELFERYLIARGSDERRRRL